MDGVIIAPNGFLDVRRILGAAGGDVYILFENDDATYTVVKMKKQGGG